MSLYTYEAVIVDVYDGDTVTAHVDMGFETYRKITVRLFGIKCPEIRGGTAQEKAAGIAARDALTGLVLERGVVIKTYKDRKEKYGRYLATIWLDGIDINKHLITLGHAQEYFP